jgi:hypothetical protein
MAENDTKSPAADEIPCQSSTTDAACSEDKQGDTGCLILFLLLSLCDAFGVVMMDAGHYAPVVWALGSVGFASGAILGIYVSCKIKKKPWWSGCRWAIYGILGMCLPAFIFDVILLRFIR